VPANRADDVSLRADSDRAAVFANHLANDLLRLGLSPVISPQQNQLQVLAIRLMSLAVPVAVLSRARR
jgi:hypothetical protein